MTASKPQNMLSRTKSTFCFTVKDVATASQLIDRSFHNVVGVWREGEVRDHEGSSEESPRYLVST